MKKKVKRQLKRVVQHCPRCGTQMRNNGKTVKFQGGPRLKLTCHDYSCPGFQLIRAGRFPGWVYHVTYVPVKEVLAEVQP